MNHFQGAAAVLGSWIVDAGSLLQSCLSGTDVLTTTTDSNVDYDKG